MRTAPKKPKAMKRKFELCVIGVDPKGRPAIKRHSLEAFTRSEARAMLKAEMGIPRKGRLPIGA